MAAERTRQMFYDAIRLIGVNSGLDPQQMAL